MIHWPLCSFIIDKIAFLRRYSIVDGEKIIFPWYRKRHEDVWGSASIAPHISNLIIGGYFSLNLIEITLFFAR